MVDISKCHMQNLHVLDVSQDEAESHLLHLKVEGKSTCDCISNIPSTKHTSTFQGAPVIILISILLERVDLSIEVLSQYDQYG